LIEQCVEGRHRRNSNHETSFCCSIGGGLCRRIYSRIRPRRPWTWRGVREPWRLRAQSHDAPGITRTADVRFRKPDSGAARGTFAATCHQRPVGAKPLRRGYVNVSRQSGEPAWSAFRMCSDWHVRRECLDRVLIFSEGDNRLVGRRAFSMRRIPDQNSAGR
jgi:hypothetical protein